MNGSFFIIQHLINRDAYQSDHLVQDAFSRKMLAHANAYAARAEAKPFPSWYLDNSIIPDNRTLPC